MTQLNNGDRCPFCSWLIVDRDWQFTEDGHCRLCWNLPRVDGWCQVVPGVDGQRADPAAYFVDWWPVTKETIYGWLRSGWMPGRKIEGIWWCTQDEVEEWENGPTVSRIPRRVYPQE